MVRERAANAAAAGDYSAAFRLLHGAAEAQPGDAALWNSAGNAAMRAGLPEDAARCFERAAQADPRSLEFAVNRAIALGKLGRDRAAIDVLSSHEGAGRRDPRYCSVRAARARAVGDLDQAAQWYDRALASAPAHARARHGRARVALERSEPDAAARFDRAIESAPGDADAWLGKAQALDAAGRFAEAAALVDALLRQAPHWADALRLRASIALAVGDADVTGAYRWAELSAPGEPAIALAHCHALAGLDRQGEAADIAAAARRRFPAMAVFAVLEARFAHEAGDTARAGAIWDSLSPVDHDSLLLHARHLIRTGDYARAAQAVDQALAGQPWSVSAWALRGLLWRLAGDPRAEWLHAQPGLVATVPLPGGGDLLGELAPALDALHDQAAFPLNQSLRGGTQTRGSLLGRHEPLFARLRQAIVEALEQYRAALPAEDLEHPLLRHRSRAWQLAGSWSVRLRGGSGDRHISHIHPEGIVSSALYVDLPTEIGDQAQDGWLEIGRPPGDLGIDLPPIAAIRPQVGMLALFPSTLFHGTRPFGRGTRMTVAFDVAPATGGAA
nr:tetratricopeptide repeat protein [Tsuneonella aeria]